MGGVIIFHNKQNNRLDIYWNIFYSWNYFYHTRGESNYKVKNGTWNYNIIYRMVLIKKL